jgi:hypothetical protein
MKWNFLLYFGLLATSYCSFAVNDIEIKGEADMNLSAGEKLILETAQGAILENTPMRQLAGVDNLENLPQVAYQTQGDGPQFLISDSPEYFRVPEGAGLREKVEPGVVKLYTYHVNALEDMERKITVVLDNLGEEPMQVRFIRRALAGPDLHYHRVGKQGLQQFFASQPEVQSRTVPAGGSIALDPEAEEIVVKHDELLHGFYEFEISQPGRITVLQTDPETPGPVASARIEKVLPPRQHSGAGRGLFQTSTYQVTGSLSTAHGPVQLNVADGEQDPWIEGTEHSIAVPAVNKGNYGVIYEIELDYESPDGRAMALMVWNHRSTAQWCGGMANVIRVSEGKFLEGFVDVPTGQIHIQDDGLVLLQVFPPPEGGKGTIRLTYSPPGASCLPTPMVFLPVQWVE